MDGKSKYMFLTSNNKANNSEKVKLPNEQVRAIFMARTRMIKAKANYKNMHPNASCIGCGQEEETQQHILEECATIHNNDNLKTKTYEVFSNNLETTKAKKQTPSHNKNHQRMVKA